MNGNTLFAVIIICVAIHGMWDRWLTHKERIKEIKSDDLSI